MSLQIVSVIGNATKDAEVRVSKDGVSYVTFRIGVSGANETTTFYNVLVFGHYGEVIQSQITKGRQIFVNGKLQISEQGYISVIADHIELLARPKPKAGEVVIKEEVKEEKEVKEIKK